MAEFRLSLADQAFANTLGFLVVQTIADPRREMAIGVLAELLPAVTEHSRMEAMFHAGVRLVDAWKYRGLERFATDWAAAQMHGRAAVETFLFWRAGMALDAWRPAPAPALETQPELFHAAE